ncbi:MAG: NYN domain-containing protein [Deltaproteobacteria bacterium]|nr:NYN domain-containing protein [Deltaproteobacteria bacterium]
MAIHLIIDGYNLIRQCPTLSLLDAVDLEAGREALLEALAAYRRRRPQHRLTVVFDGWQSGDLKETRDQFQGITVIFSRRGERADEVIKRLLARERQRALVVSSDRELQEYAQRVGADWLEAGDFDNVCLSGTSKEFPEEEEDRPRRGTRKKGPARRLSKPERRRRQRLKKL